MIINTQKKKYSFAPSAKKKFLNITEEALAIGKVPPEDVARMLASRKFRTQEDFDQFSPRTKEMAMISTIIKDAFK